MAFTPTGVEFVTKGLNGYLSDLKKADKANQNLGSGAEGIGSKVAGATGKVVALGAAAAATAGVAAIGGLVLGLKSSIETAISFESAFAGVIKTTDGLTDATGQLNLAGQELRQEFVDLSKEVPLAFEELAAIGELGGQLGIGQESLIDFTETIAGLGVSTNLSTDEAATAIARLNNIYQVNASDVGLRTQQIGSTVVALGNNFATTESEIVSFASRIAGAGQIAGLTQSDILAIGTALSSVGVEAEAGGTAVQKVLLGINNAVNGSTTGFVDNTDAINKNVEKLQNLNAESARLEATAPGLQQEILAQYDAFIAAGGSAEDFGRQLGDKTRQKAFEVAKEIRNLTNETDLLRESQGQPIPTGQLEQFARIAGKSADEFKELWEEDASQAFELFVEGLAREGDNAANVLDELGLADQRLIRGFLSLAGAGDLLSETFITASGAFAENTALTEEAEKRYQTTEAQIQILKNTVRALGDNIGSRLLPYVNQGITALKEWIDAAIIPLGNILENTIIPAVSSFVLKIGELIGAIQGILPSFEELKNSENIFQDLFGAESLEEVITTFIAQIPEKLSSIVTSITDFLVTKGPEIGEKLRAWANDFWIWVEDVAAQAGMVLVAIISAVYAWAFSGETQGQLLELGNALGQALVDGIAFLLENAEQYNEILSKVVLGLGAAVLAVTGLLIAIGGQIVAGILQGILEKMGIELETATINELGGILSGIADNALTAAKIIGTNIILGISQGILDGIDQLTTTLEQIAFIITHTVKTALGIESPSTIFADIGINIVQGLINGISGMLSSLGEIAGSILDVLFGGAEEITLDITTLTETLPKALLDIQSKFQTIASRAQAIGLYLSTIFVEQITLSFTSFNEWLDKTIEKLEDIHANQFPSIQSAVQNTGSIWISVFSRINSTMNSTNAILRTMDNLLNKIRSSLGKIESAAKDALDSLMDMDKAVGPLNNLKNAIDEVTVAFQNMKEAADEAGNAANNAGSDAEASTGTGFSTGAGLGASKGIGFANGTLGFTVPPGFPNDSFPMRVESGEQVLVSPRGTTIDEIVQRNFLPNAPQVNVNISGVNINNGMDLAMFQSLIQQTVTESLA